MAFRLPSFTVAHLITLTLTAHATWTWSTSADIYIDVVDHEMKLDIREALSRWKHVAKTLYIEHCESFSTMPIASLSTSSAGFNLSSNDEFKNRSNDVFASLGALEQKDASHERHTASEDTRKRPSDDKSDVDNQPGSSKDPETRQNTFKIPKCVDEPSTSGDGGKKYDYYFRKPPKRDAKKQKPDFRVHPKNWTKYSLTDIKSDQMSDEANKKAALSFLAERQEQHQRETASTSKTEDCGSEKIVFTKPSEKCLEAATAETATSPSPSTSGTRVNANFGAKHVMPEYVVGESKKKKKKKSSNSSLRCDKVNLDHLLNEDTE